MLRARYMRVTLKPVEDGLFFVTASKADGGALAVADWRNLLFFRHEESFYGTMVRTKRIDGVEGVLLNGWELVTLFAHEPFNRFIEWDWDELAEICLAAAPAVFEAIDEQDWLPDFAAWEKGEFRWALPERVLTEFGPAFWEQSLVEDEDRVADSAENLDLDAMSDADSVEIPEFGAIAETDSVENPEFCAGAETDSVENPKFSAMSETDSAKDSDSGAGVGDVADAFGGAVDASVGDVDEAGGVRNPISGIEAKTPVLGFVQRWYDGALDAFLRDDDEMRALFGEKLEFLRSQGVSSGALSAFFQKEESWKQWMGLQVDDAPFSVGLQLEEPVDAEAAWSLRLFLRSRADENVLVDVVDAPVDWRPFVAKVDEEVERWLAVFPWLGADGARVDGGSPGVAGANEAGSDGSNSLWDVESGDGHVVRMVSGAAADDGARVRGGEAVDVSRRRVRGELSEDEAWRFLTDASETLIALGVEILLPGWWQAMKNANLKVKAHVKGGSSRGPSFVGLDQMLDYDWRFSMNGVDLSESEFQQLVDEKRRLVFVRGRWIKLDPAFIKQIQGMMMQAEKQGLTVRDLLEQELAGAEDADAGADGAGADELENPQAFARIRIELNRSWKSMMSQLSGGKEIPMVDVPAGFCGELRPYQQFGMSWLLFLRKVGFGAVLADDMGLGKTVQLLCYLLAVKEKAESGGAVVGASVARADSVGGAGSVDEGGEDAAGAVSAGGDGDAGAVVARTTEDAGGKADSVSGGGVAKIEAAAVENSSSGRSGSGAGCEHGDGSGVSMESSDDGEKLGNGVPISMAGRKQKNRPSVSKRGSASLIVCPTSVLGNWQHEVARFAPGLKVYLHYGSGRLKGEAFRERVREADIVLTSYGLTHMDVEDFAAVSWNAIAIDEAQNIKNAATKQSRAVRKLRGKHHIALTGTPMENRLSELWSIFDFTNHGYLGSLGQFQKRYVAPIEKDGDKKKIEKLQALIRPFLLRRSKQDEDVALNLPDKQEQKEYCPLTAEQASLYEQLIRDTFAQVEQLSGFERKGLILSMLGKLKQLCNHPALYLKESKPRDVLARSEKLSKLVELVGAVLEAGESCLIFTQYIEMGEMIRGLLAQKFGLDVPFLNGSVPKTQRDLMIGRFQDREFPVFLLSLKAGGTGLNLTAANHVIHYDRWWNPAVENQATDRAYRIGQSRFVHVHKFISTGTLEEKIDAMLEKKQSLNDAIIVSENWITELDNRELEELLRLG